MPGMVAGRTGLRDSYRPPKRRRASMLVSTYNARTLAADAVIEDLMMRTRMIRYDVIGLTETRRHHPLNVVYDVREEMFLGAFLLRKATKESKLSIVPEKFYREDHNFYKIIVGDFNAKIAEELYIWTHSLQWNEQRDRLSEYHED
ncbi:hypothetical protein NECAME_15807 [Necator americanus]|uniref:Endonuclease/exonuclease/phosphatase domain-containing protein n=1 Tax=Necator americanus TaxID=51031 RepID=W2SI83_NECAM|nr:hypothetical protein NECAME_15807 [Necator americanus]ETN68467.1 hypothetical protein NECAME_15807 [Necator americanus]